MQTEVAHLDSHLKSFAIEMDYIALNISADGVQTPWCSVLYWLSEVVTFILPLIILKPQLLH